MPKILWYVPTVGRGGVTRVIETLSHAIDQVKPDGWQFDILGQTFNEIGQRVRYPEAWPFTQLDPGAEIPPHPKQFNWLLNQAETFIAHLQRVQDEYDLIFCPSPWWTMRVKNFPHEKPFVTVVPDFAFDSINMGGLSGNFRYVAREVSKHAALTVFPSDTQRKHGEKYYGFRQTQTIHHSADFVADHFEATHEEGVRVREKLGLPDGYVLAFHCYGHKDPVTVLVGHRWAMQHGQEIGTPVPPLVLGGIGTQHYLENEPAPDSHSEHVRAVIKQLDYTLGKDLFIVGQIDDEDIAGLYMGASMVVTASQSEGDLSGTIFEAFMASRPLIFSDLDVFTEQLGLRGDYGLHFPVMNPQALGTRIIEVLQTPDQSRARALRAFGFANSRNVQDVANDYLMAFSELLVTPLFVRYISEKMGELAPFEEEDYQRVKEALSLQDLDRMFYGEWVEPGDDDGVS